MKKQWIIGAACVALAAAFVPSGASAAEKETIPNPMVSYDSVLGAEKAAGFRALYLPEISGYHLESVYVIDGKMIDLRYQQDGNLAGKLTLRTEKLDRSAKGMAKPAEKKPQLLTKGKQVSEPVPNTSGIHGAAWTKETINDVRVRIAKVTSTDRAASKDGYVAAWKTGGKAFSAYYEGIDKPAFLHQLQSALIPLSQNYFKNFKK
ncbi:MAG: hypothetical protein MR669_03710 [Selenomonadaceae bacterium]|nr:hypothetical protein [Selenomonadaceae bacterium]